MEEEEEEEEEKEEKKCEICGKKVIKIEIRDIKTQQLEEKAPATTKKTEKKGRRRKV